MINKLKIGLVTLGVLSLVVFGGTASAANLTWGADQTVDLSSPDMDLTIASGSTATSLVVGTGTLVVGLVSGETFTVATASSGSFTFDPLTDVSQTCVSGVTTLTVAATTTATYTLTPSTTACVSGGGGGGGGGGAYPTPYQTPSTTTPATPATPATPGTNVPGCGNRTTGFSESTGASCVGNTATTPATPATPATPGSGGTYNLGTSTLKNGSKGTAVMELQRLLNTLLNLGLKIDGILGPKTIAVIKKWQKQNGLAADGLVGPKTKAAMKAQAGAN